MRHQLREKSQARRVASEAILCVFGLAMFGCVGVDEGNENELEVTSAVTRPSLSSICSSACSNLRGKNVCTDSASQGGVHVRVFPRLEGKTKTPATEINNPGSWSGTSCPNCEWHLVSVSNLTVPFPPTWTTSTNSVQLNRNAVLSDWSGQVKIQITDPTDASVGVCNLSVGVELINGRLD